MRSRWRFVVFPGLWLASLIVVFLLRTQSSESAFISAILLGGLWCGFVGVLTLAASRNWRGVEAVKNLLMIAIIVPVGSASLNLAVSIYYDLIWNNAISCNAADRSSLVSEKVQHFSSKSGLYVASLRREFCDYGFGQGTIAYYLFVRRQSEPDGSDNIALAYDAAESGLDRPPKIVWLNETSLAVRVGSGDISRITTLRSPVTGILFPMRWAVRAIGTKIQRRSKRISGAPSNTSFALPRAGFSEALLSGRRG